MAEVEARTVLWHLTFIGFIINYMIRININITIVDMIAGKGNPRSLSTSSSMTLSPNSSAFPHKYSMERHFLDWANIDYEKEGFHWNEYEQGLLLGSFFWAHWVLQIPGGVLARKYGTKLVFGLANWIGVLCCFFMPIVSYWSFTGLIWLRVFQGFVTGLAWPSMHVLTAKWIPPNERSKFVTAYLGSSVGVALFYPIFGYVIHWTSWEWVYHISGIIGTAWYIAWQYFVYDSPAEHPRIAQSELRYIEKSLGAAIQSNNHGPTPWRAIMTSLPVWMNIIAQWGGIWALFTLMTQIPTYFRVIYGFTIEKTGIISGVPHLMRMLFAYVFSIFADYLLRTDRMSRTNVRKLATAICCLLKGLVVLALAYYGRGPDMVILFVIVATMLHGAVSSGPLAAIVDISPNYAGIVLGVSGMIGVMPGFISPYIVGLLTLNNQTKEAWQNVFLITAGMLIGSGVLYVFFADATLQPWNDGCQPIDSGIEELHLVAEKEPLNLIEEKKTTTTTTTDKKK